MSYLSDRQTSKSMTAQSVVLRSRHSPMLLVGMQNDTTLMKDDLVILITATDGFAL